MVTVKQFLDAGFKFVVDDVLALSNNQKATYDLTPADLSAIEEGQERYSDDFVIDLAWRKNTGVQPVGGDCWVEVLYSDGENDLAWANAFRWEDKDLTHGKPSLKHLEQQMTDNQETKTALEMSERDIENYADTRCVFEWDGKGIPPVGCECDILDVDNEDVVIGDGKIYYIDGKNVFIVSDFIKHYPNESTIVDFENGKNLYVMYISEGDVRFKKKETPEQKAARERDEAVNIMLKDTSYICTVEEFRMNKLSSSMSVMVEFMFDLYDAGYRKQ